MGLSGVKFLGTIIVIVHEIRLVIDFGKKHGSLDGSIYGSNHGKFEVLFIEGPLRYI